jgi:hypothetical protein
MTGHYAQRVEDKTLIFSFQTIGRAMLRLRLFVINVVSEKNV